MELVGRTLGRYQVREKLGRGGMGMVYKGYDPTLEREVAIKVLAPHLAWEQEFVQRFLREARVAAKLAHPNIVTVYEVGQEGDLYYFVMAYLPGPSLAEIVAREGPLPLPRAVSIAGQVASALDYVHRQGLVHRDVKSSNVLLDSEGRAVLTDFGIVRALEGTRLTSPDRMLGTPRYMAPEQAREAGATSASDLYSLGIVVYEMLGGGVPFEATTPLATLVKQMYDSPPALREKNPAVPEAVERAVFWALAKDPRSRPASAADFVAALRAGLGMKEASAAVPEVPAVPPLPPSLSSPYEAEGAGEGEGPIPSLPRRIRLPAWFWVLAGVALLVLVLLVAEVVYLVAQRGALPPQPLATKVYVPTAQATATAPPSVEQTAAGVLPPCTSGGQEWTRPTDGMVLVCVPQGSLTMGSADGDLQADVDEKPQHTVTLDAFWVDRTEVTVGQFRRFVQATGHRTTAEEQGAGWVYVAGTNSWEEVGGADWQYPQGPGSAAAAGLPVVQVSWADAAAYCAWAGGALPTEAQWEMAARGTDGRIYPWGNEFDGTRVNYCDANCPGGGDGSYDDGYGYAAPVGSYANGASPYGVLDMAGNVWEWVQDWYSPYSAAAQTNPAGATFGDGRVVRGGAWNSGAERVRAAYRGRVEPAGFSANRGFRCVVPAR